MSEQRLSQLQCDILTTVRDAPPMQLGDDFEISLSRRRVFHECTRVRVGPETFRLGRSVYEGDVQRGSVPVVYVRWTVARARQQVYTWTEKDQYGKETRTRSSLNSAFQENCSRSLRNLEAKHYLTLSTIGKTVMWVTLTRGGASHRTPRPEPSRCVNHKP